MQFRFAILALVSLLFACAPAPPRGPIVLAAASLQGPLDEVADSWAAKGHSRPVLSYAGSPSIARLIMGGAPADIVVLADNHWMDQLENDSFIKPSSRRNVLGNSLVVVEQRKTQSESSVAPSSSSLEAALAVEKIAMGDPDSVPAGRYAKEALGALGMWDDVKTRIVPTENVRVALRLAERGEVSAAIVYASDAQASSQVTVRAGIASDAHSPILYPAALVSEASHPDANEFLEFLGSGDAKTILASHGLQEAQP